MRSKESRGGIEYVLTEKQTKGFVIAYDSFLISFPCLIIPALFVSLVSPFVL